MHPMLRPLLGVVVVVLMPTRTQAQNPLRLSEFVAEVEAENPSLTAGELRTKAARQRVGPARAMPDTFVAVGIDQLALGRADDDGSERWPRPVLRYQVNQTVPLAAKRRARADAAAAGADVLGADVVITRRSLRVAATQLFLRALYIQRALDTNAKLDETLAEVVASAEARYVTGGTAHHEILLTRAERAVLRRDALVLLRTLAVLHAEMNELRGLPAASPPPTLVDDGGAPSPTPLSFGLALSRQPELRAADLAVDSANARERVARAAGLPDISVQVMAMQSLTPGMPSNLGAMVGLSVPLGWNRKYAPAIRAATQERRAADQDRVALRRRLDAEWVAAEAAHDSAVDTVALYEAEVLPDLRAAVESARAGYVAQKVSLVELLAVVRANFGAELEHEAARIDVRLAQLRRDELLSMPSVLRLAPSSPTLLAPAMGGGMQTSGPMSSTPQARPIRMGTGMQAPTLDTGDTSDAMGGMR